MNTQLVDAELRVFSKNFDNSYEDAAACSRGDFLRAFPLNSLKRLTLDDYVIGKGTASFCARVEAKTKAWANIQGATAYKFGIYYGRTKSDPKHKYRFTKKFGTKKIEAFNAVKESLNALLVAGKAKKFQEIDNNPLSQMFKAKILSLYYPGTYLNVCSSEHLELISMELGLTENLYSSEYQNLLIEIKLKNVITQGWSNPKFMSFLYAKFIRKDLEPMTKLKLRKPTKRSKKSVNFQELQATWGAIGKKSEEFALAWEKDRLIGLGLDSLVEKIRDRREKPSFGYDFLSFSTAKQERFIEVKSLGFDRKENCFRFFLSENEQIVSKSNEHLKNYYFYMVRYGKGGEPQDVIVKRAIELYSNSEVLPCAYVVRVSLEDGNN